MADQSMAPWVLPVTLLVGGLLLALIRLLTGMDKKSRKNKKGAHCSAVL